jgi:hypothetical protein
MNQQLALKRVSPVLATPRLANVGIGSRAASKESWSKDLLVGSKLAHLRRVLLGIELTFS